MYGLSEGDEDESDLELMICEVSTRQCLIFVTGALSVIWNSLDDVAVEA